MSGPVKVLLGAPAARCKGRIFPGKRFASRVAPFTSSPLTHPIPQSRCRARGGIVQRLLMQALGLPVSAGAGHDAVAEGDGDSRKQENKMDAGLRHYRLFIVRAGIDESFQEMYG